MIPDDVLAALVAWAAQTPQVQRMWVFGSRVRGDNGPASDLDVAIELVQGLDESNGLATWMFESPAWVEQLQAVIPFTLDLQQFAGTETPVIGAGLARSSMMVYARSDVA